MADLTELEKRIQEFENLLDEMRAEKSAAHEVLKDIRAERKMIEQLQKGAEVKALARKEVERVIKKELDEIGPEIRKQTSLIYDRVGEQVDKLINLTMGREWSVKHNSQDLRPQLADKLRVWIREVIEKEQRETQN